MRKKLTQTRKIVSSIFIIKCWRPPIMPLYSVTFLDGDAVAAFLSRNLNKHSDSWARDWLSVVHRCNSPTRWLPSVTRRTFWFYELFFVRIALLFVQGKYFFCDICGATENIVRTEPAMTSHISAFRRLIRVNLFLGRLTDCYSFNSFEEIENTSVSGSNRTITQSIFRL